MYYQKDICLPADPSAGRYRRGVGKQTAFVVSVADWDVRCRTRLATRFTRQTGCVVLASTPHRGVVLCESTT